MKFCQDGCRAALFNHLLFWIAWKNQGQAQKVIESGEITYFATNEELIEHMANVWSDKKVRSEVNALVDLGVIGRTKNQKWGTDRTKHFYFAREQYNKLIELCKKHQICLAHIGLPKEIINFLAAFNKSIECPCTKQTVNLLEANGKSTECNEPFLPNANGKFDRNNNKDNSKDNSKGNYERKNGASQQEVNVSTQDEDHSFIHSSLSLSSSQETKQTKPAIVLTEKEQRIIKFGKKDIFKAADPIIDEKLKEECAKLAELIETQEQFDSLVAIVRKRFPKGAIHLKNLTKPNVLNEWSQAQEQCTPDTQVPSAPDNDFVVTDNELAEDIKKTVRFYDADDRFEECLESIMDFKRKAGLSNYKVCDMIANASIGVHRDRGIDAFLEKLQYSLYW